MEQFFEPSDSMSLRTSSFERAQAARSAVCIALMMIVWCTAGGFCPWDTVDPREYDSATMGPSTVDVTRTDLFADVFVVETGNDAKQAFADTGDSSNDVSRGDTAADSINAMDAIDERDAGSDSSET